MFRLLGKESEEGREAGKTGEEDLQKSISSVAGDVIGGVDGTYTNVQLNSAPQYQHCRVAVLCDCDDLNHSHDGADGSEQAEHENANQTNLAPEVDLDFHQQWDRHAEDDEVAEY